MKGYSDSEIHSRIRKTFSSQRELTLQKLNHISVNQTPLVKDTKYNPYVKGIKKKILKYRIDMTDDFSCKEAVNFIQQA